jgi:hypothetical protein
MASRSLGIPPLGGIASYEQATRPGIGVEDNVTLLKRFAFVERRLMEIEVAHLCAVPEWEVKCALSLHAWLDAEHATSFRHRVAEMREPPLHLDEVPDRDLGTLLDETLRAHDSVELLVGLYRVIRPTLIEAYRRHLAESNPLADHPTRRLLRIAVMEEEEMVEWGEAALAALLTTPEAEEHARAWRRHLEAYLHAAGGIWGDEPRPTAREALPAPRSAEPFEMSLFPARDDRFTTFYQSASSPDEVYHDESRSPYERTIALMYKRLREMDVPEMMAPIIARTEGKPWEYYRELARQLWDEARHAMMGEVGFESLGVDWTAIPMAISFSYLLNNYATPLEAHGRLYAIEQGLMKQTGKRSEWEVAQGAGIPLSVNFQDYDWADEVLHAQIGRRWFVREVGDRKRAEEIIIRANARLEEAQATDSAFAEDAIGDWWPSFYDSIRPANEPPPLRPVEPEAAGVAARRRAASEVRGVLSESG